MATFTPTQGRYLAFIHAYIQSHGCPPAESDVARAMCVSGPSVNQMVKKLEKEGLILRHPGQARSIQILVPEDEIPPWNNKKKPVDPSTARWYAKPPADAPLLPPANLFVLTVFLKTGPLGDKFDNTEVSRVIEIRGDQTLHQLYEALFQAYDRREEKRYEFQFGKRPFDPDGPNFGIPNTEQPQKGYGDARTTKLDDLGLNGERVFGYLFDFRDKWFHWVQLEKIEKAIPTVTYPRIIKRVGESPPQKK